MVEYGFAIDPGQELFLSVSPEMIHADHKIHGIQYDKRQCFLADEKSLEYYQHYTFLNCFMECASNYTFNVSHNKTDSLTSTTNCNLSQVCGCVAYYMPRHPSYMPICSPEKTYCVEKAVKEVEQKAYDDSSESSLNCHCLPPCSDIEFPHETSSSKLRADLIHYKNNITGVAF